jgi:hypothetical protein
VNKVGLWLEHWELSNLCQIFKQNAIHGGMLWGIILTTSHRIFRLMNCCIEITTSDLVYMGVANALHMLKVKVLIEYAKQGKLKRSSASGGNCVYIHAVCSAMLTESQIPYIGAR